MYHSIVFNELRLHCRKYIESLENWSRRLIHEQLTNEYGDNYYDAVGINNEMIINKEIRRQADRLINENPDRFFRFVDTLFLDDIIYILCHPKFYKKLFKEALDISYPLGREEVRVFLKRIIPARNALCHANPISMRQAEQVICYCNDFVFGLREYYRKKGAESMWNIPKIIKAVDSLGNVYFPKTGAEDSPSKNFCPSKEGVFCIGDTYSLELEIDPSFDPSEYAIKWFESLFNERKDLQNQLTYSKTFTIKDVKQAFHIQAKIISSNEWHKFTGYDDDLNIRLSILPPM